MSCGSESGTTPRWPRPQRIGSHSATPSSSPPLPRNGCPLDTVSPVSIEPPNRSSSPVEQKKNVCVVTSCFGVHMFALTTVFCLRKSESVLIRRSNLNRSDSIHVDPKKRLVFNNFGRPGPMYRVRGSPFVSSVS